MQQKIDGNQNEKRIVFPVICLIVLILLANIGYGQEKNFIWLKTFKPGSANLKDASIDKNMLAFVDSLMKKDNIDVTFLGASDDLRWKQTGNVDEISKAWDQAKKLERASSLRERYAKGNIGTTDESIRGVKVVWGPKEPNPFELKERIKMLENLTDSLTLAVLALHSNNQKALAALQDSILNGSMKSYSEVSQNLFAWELSSGLFVWSQGAPYDLTVPYLGVTLERKKWAVEFQGGFTPWSRKYSDGNRSDAFLMSSFNLFPDDWYEIKIGAFSGWEFFTSSDEWTMKVMGLTAGPNFKWKILNLYIGSNFSKLSTLENSGKWGHSLMVTTSVNIKL